MRSMLRATLVLFFTALVGVQAQELPDPMAWSDVRPACAVQQPAQLDRARFVPVVVLFAPQPGAEAASAALLTIGKVLARSGFLVVAPVLETKLGPRGAQELFGRLRRLYRIEQGGLHALVGGDTNAVLPFLLAHRVEFQTITTFGEASAADLAALRRLPARRVHAVKGGEPEGLAMHLQKLHAERTLPGAAGEVAKVLDDFHDAAAIGDEQRYFAILPDDALFLGTDGTERWTGSEFRKFAMPHFQRDSAWTYVTLHRHVDVDAGGAFAWFDETFDNEAYGECRGSGVLSKRDGRWLLRQYHLTVPVPNDVTPAVTARIRAFQAGISLAPTKVVLVRHAEKAGPDADELSDVGRRRAESLALVLRDFTFDAIYASGKVSTAQTVGPIAAAKALSTRTQADPKRMVEALARDHFGQTVLVCGHSNTIPEMLRALGVETNVAIGDDEYDRLFVVTLMPDGPHLLTLRY